MNRKALYFLFGIIILVGQYRMDAQTIRAVSDHTISAKENAKHQQKSNQQLLNALSASGEKDLDRIQLSYRCMLDAWLSQQGPDYDEYTILANVEFLGGDASYRLFDLRSVLLPDLFRLESENQNYNAFQSEQEFTAGSRFVLRLPASAAEADFRVAYLAFSAAKRSEVLQQIATINLYWASIKLIDSLLTLAEKTDFEASLGYVGFFTARDMLRKAILNANRTLDQIRSLKPSDPGLLQQRLASAGRLMTRYQTLMLAQRDPREKNSRLVAQAVGRKQIHYLRASLKGDYRDNELMLNMSRLWPDDQLLTQFERMGADENDIPSAFALFAEELRLADSLLNRSEYAFALNFYDDALQWANLSGLRADRQAITERTEIARLGLLRSHLHIAAMAVQTGNMQLAETYRERASAYAQVRHTSTMASKLPRQSDELVKAYLRQAQLLADQKRYPEAIRMYEQAAAAAREFYNIDHELAITEGLFRVHRLVYMDLVKEAEELHHVGRTDDARRRLQQALAYRADHPEYLRTSMEAVQLMQKIGQLTNSSPLEVRERDGNRLSSTSVGTASLAKQEILRKVPDVQLKVWSNELQTAWQMYDELIRLQKENMLDNDPDIKHAFAELDERLIERICLNHRLNIQEWTQKAKQNLQRGTLDEVEKLLTDALETAVNNQGCQLDASEARQLLEWLSPVLAYHREYRQLLKTVAEQGIKNAAPQYIAFDNDVSKFGAERFGIKHVTFNEFVLSQNSLPIWLQAAQFYLEQMNDEALMTLMGRVSELQFRRNEIEPLLRKAGTLFAVADHAKGTSNYGLIINNLVKGDPRLLPLGKAYRSAAKQLK